MAGYERDAREVIQKIRADLKDRYTNTFAILKELFQNADDAKAKALTLDLRDGFPGAANPLLCGPGLLVCNDGRYASDDERGIRHASATTKTAETGSAGRFGIGLKSVHHLSDAFIVLPLGYAPALQAFVVNPYYDLAAAREQTQRWEAFGEDDRSRLASAIDQEVFPGPLLAFWLPLRRSDLRPAPLPGFVDERFDGEAERGGLASRLDRPAETAAMMAAARHLERFDLRRDGASVVTVRRSGERIEYTSLERDRAGRGDERRNYAGTVTVDTSGGSQELRFSGREMLSADALLTSLKADRGWPETIDFDGKPQREKAIPHGACVLASGGSFLPRLSIREGVFLPIGEDAASRDATSGRDSTAAQTIIELGAFGPRLDLFLHGYYFVDPGRREILGAADEGSIPQRWNAALRDHVVMPALPLLFQRAVADRVLSPADLAAVVRALRASPWFGDRHAAVCRSKLLAEVWNGRALAWGCFDPTARLRPLPARLLGTPDRLAALLPELESFARQHGLSICTADEDGAPRALAGRAPAWEAAELAGLIEGVPAAALRQRREAADFAALLAVARRDGVPDAEVGRALRAKLREVLRAEVANQAADDTMKGIMRHVPRGAVVFLPADDANFSMLSALASAPVDALVVRASWKPEDARSFLAERSSVAPLLRALEPLALEDGDDRRVTRAALEIVEASNVPLQSLAGDRELNGIRLFPATLQPANKRQILSVQSIAAAAKGGTLFIRTVETNRNAPLLFAAVRGASFFTILPNDADLFKSAVGPGGPSGALDGAAIISFIERAAGFSDDAEARGELLRSLIDRESHWRRDPARIAAARRLVAGDRDAGRPDAKLYRGAFPSLAPLVERAIARDPATFLAAEAALGRIAPQDQDPLGLTPMRGEDLEGLLRRCHVSGTLRPSLDEGEALLSCALLGDERFDALLRDLPIHALEAGGLASLGEAEVLRPDQSRPVPPALAGLMRRVVPADDEGARARQRRLLPPHDALAELRAAVHAPGDNVGLRDVILDALAEVGNGALPADLLYTLREKTWLSTHGHHVAPWSVLALPDAVGNVARAALKDGAGASLHLVEDLPEAVRGHRGFARHRGALLPDARLSFSRLAEMIGEASPVGLPVAWEEGQRANLAALARVDLGLPAWSLAAALLGVCDPGAADCLAALAPARSAEELGCALNALAEAAGWPAVAEAGCNLYRAAFKQGVPNLGAVDRRRLFGAIAVPTAAGKWKHGSEVASRGDGLAPSCMLDYGLAEVLIKDGEPDPGGVSAPDLRSSPDTAVQDLETPSAEGFRSLLEGVRGRIEADIALTLLGTAGRFPAMREAMAHWQGTHGDAAQHLDAMDEASKIGCGPRHMETQNRERRFLVKQVRGTDVPAIALSGIRFDARKGDATSLVIGNDHEEGVRQGAYLVHTLQLQFSALEGVGVREMTERLRGLVRAVVGCWPRASDSLKGADHFPGMRGEPSQTVLEETQAALREDLPALLKLLKTKQRLALRALVDDNVKASERRLSTSSSSPGDDRAAAEKRLWDGLKADERAQTQLLDCVRESLKNFEYDPARVVFELYQNADDATLQRDAGEGPLAFRLSGYSDGFDAVHWGRPINDRGRDRASGENNNYHRDLRNMLMLHASEKDGADTTGKYGIGFKSVHLLSRDVRIASGLLAARIAGGILPFEWNAGPDQVTPLYKGGRPATLIRVIYDAGHAQQGRKAVERFAECAPYLPLFARRICCVEVDGMDHARSEKRSVPGVADAYVATVRGPCGFEALVLRLGEGFTLAMKLGATGPEPFPPGAPRLWWTAPLDERLDAGWMLNGPFTLSANRVALADGAEAREERFKNLGVALGRQLLALHRVAAADWDDFRDALGLDRDAMLPLFCARLWDLFRRDLGDAIAGMLHGPGRGLGPLSAEAPVVPTGRGGENRIRAGEVAGVVAGAMCDRAIRDAMADWDSAAALSDRVVDGATAVDLERLGHPQAPVSAAGLLRRELDAERCRVSPETAARLGAVFHLGGTYRAPLESEGQAIREVAAGALFRDRSGAWRAARGLVVPRQNDDVDDLRAAFAPDDAVLADDYGPEASAFVLLARAQAGYPPLHQTMLDWAHRAATVGARMAALRYLTTQNQWDPFATGFRTKPPIWAGNLLDGSPGGPLTTGWTDDELARLRAVLHDYRQPIRTLPETGASPDDDIAPSPPLRSPAEVLESIWRWWDVNRAGMIAEYERAVYPAGFHLSRLKPSANKLDLSDREGWFTFLALACFQSFGRTRDGQHRKFIESEARDWWAELAQAPPERDPDVWITRLREWSRDDDVSYWEWRRCLIDLHRIAWWLPEYARAITLLPRAIGAAQLAVPSLRELLAPGASPLWRQAGLEAASLPRTLGLGANWMVRELVRSGFWLGEDAKIMASYGWASTGRVRRLMSRLRFDIDDRADMDRSRDIWTFVSGHLLHRPADLLSDGDLPLQILTLKEERFTSVLEACFSMDEDSDGLFRDAAE